MRNTKTGFTLVELIVVITILAILGTIAFISLGSYTADARNAKRLDGISKVATTIGNDQLSGKSLLAYVTADAINNSTAPDVGGTTAVIGTSYQAGPMNATALGVKASDFQDPSSSKPYVVGVTTQAGGSYEVAATLEEGGGKVAGLVGTYSPRKGLSVAGTANGTSVQITDATDINAFKPGDTTNNGVVASISPDGMIITFDGSVDPATSPITLTDESDGLIGGVNSAGTAATGYVADNSALVLPY